MTQSSSIMKKLWLVSQQEKNEIFKHFNLTEKDYNSMLLIFKEWLEKNLDIFEDIGDCLDNISLVFSKMNIEKAKETVYDLLKLKYKFSNLFLYFNPNTDYYKESKKYGHIAIIPNLTPSLQRIVIYKFTQQEILPEDGTIFYIVAIIWILLGLFADFCLGNIVVLDLENVNFKILLKHTPTLIRFLKDLHSMKLRLKTINFINCPPFMDQVLLITKAVMPSKIFSRIQIHGSLQDLHQCVPKEYLPSDYGGNQRSMEEIHERMCAELEKEEYEKYFAINSRLTQDLLREFLKTRDDYFDGDEFGTRGTFRKLEVD